MFSVFTKTGVESAVGFESRLDISGEKITLPYGWLGIGIQPSYGLDVNANARMGDVAFTGALQGATRLAVGTGDLGQNFVSAATDPATCTGALFLNTHGGVGSETSLRMVADNNLGAGSSGVVDLIARRDTISGASSFIIKTKTGTGADEGFDTQFRISGAAILVNHDALPTGNPGVRGQLWLKPKSSTPGSSYLLVSSGAAP
jgi:hypothetical protein